MKTFFFLIASFYTLISAAQVTKVSLQASGLTCSMCSNSINKSLKNIPSVDKINADIKTSTFEITFKKGSIVDFDQIKKKVENAGFSVSNFIATIQFKNVQVKGISPVTIGDKTFRFLNVKDQALNGEVPVRLIDKGFVSSKEYKKYSAQPAPAGSKIYNATI